MKFFVKSTTNKSVNSDVFFAAALTANTPVTAGVEFVGKAPM